MNRVLTDISNLLPVWGQKLADRTDLLISDLSQIAEIPSPTFSEARRCQALVEKFISRQLTNCSIDEAGNCVAVLPGKNSAENILIAAHLDSLIDEDSQPDHACGVQPDFISAPGISDNALGVAALAVLPELLAFLDINLNANLVFIGSSCSLGQGNLAGLRFFLKNTKMKFKAGLIVEGCELGRLSYVSIGMRRCELTFSPKKPAAKTSHFSTASPIVAINDIINYIQNIPLPTQPRTRVAFTSLVAGAASGKVVPWARLSFEMRSESDKIIQDLIRRVRDIADHAAADNRGNFHLNIVSRTSSGGLDYHDPLVSAAKKIMGFLKIKPEITPSVGELSVFTSRRIPALTIGLSRVENYGLPDEKIAVKPLKNGLLQLLALIKAVDGDSDES